MDKNRSLPLKPFVLGIVGGTGSGKSTLAFAIQEKYLGQVVIVQLDDYFKKRKDLPLVNGKRSYDHPESIYHDKLFKDLSDLKNGKSIKVLTKSPKYNPDYESHKIKLPITLHPAPLIIVEGFLILHYPDIREILDASIYLDMDINTSTKRRFNLVENEIWYVPNVAIPAHNEYIKPSSKYANLVLNVDKLTAAQVMDKVNNNFLKNFSIKFSK